MKMEAAVFEPVDAATPSELAANLGLLAAVEHDSSVTQRSLASRMGIALGLTNAYLRRAVSKGWIKISQAPARRYLYYVTPQGFAEKARLTREYLSDSLTLFRRIRNQCDDAFRACVTRGWTRVVLVGAGDLAEIATLSARDHGIELVAIVDQKRNTEQFAGVTLVHSLAAASAHDAILLTDMDDPQAMFDELSRTTAAERIVLLPILHVNGSRRVKVVVSDAGSKMPMGDGKP